jgi:hypothetical protein
MTSARPAPPLPSPRRPADAAREVCRAAQAAASAWAQPLEPGAHSRAVSQLYSALRDLGIATRGLAAYTADTPEPGPGAPDYERHTAAGARWLLDANERLDGVLAAEGIPPSRDPDDPGAALCPAARDAILAWRQPSGTAADRDEAVRRLIAATGFLTAAVLGLATWAPRRLAVSIQTAGASIAESTAYLTAAIRPPEGGGE